jgi:hypothetical protein
MYAQEKETSEKHGLKQGARANSESKKPQQRTREFNLTVLFPNVASCPEGPVAGPEAEIREAWPG